MLSFTERDARIRRWWKHLIVRTFEDQLGVTPIRSGDSVIIRKAAFSVGKGKKGGTAVQVSARPL